MFSRKLGFVLILAMGSSACVARVRAKASMTAVAEPTLVLVSPGVWVIEDHDEPVFYSDGYYWRTDGHIWFRSSVHTSGWIRWEAPPVHVRTIDRPQRYIRWHAAASAERHRGRPDVTGPARGNRADAAKQEENRKAAQDAKRDANREAAQDAKRDANREAAQDANKKAAHEAAAADNKAAKQADNKKAAQEAAAADNKAAKQADSKKAAQEQAKADAKAAKEQEKADAKAAKEQEKADKKAAQEQAKADAKAAKEQEKADKKAAQEEKKDLKLKAK